MSMTTGKIIFFEGENFQGLRLEASGEVESFLERRFPGCVGSARVESGAWLCFEHAHLQGQQLVLEHGEYAHLRSWGDRCEEMGSCRPVHMFGENFSIELFEGADLTGQCVELNEDCPLLVQVPTWGRRAVASIRVRGDGAWVLYDDSNYRGRQYLLERGVYRCPAAWKASSGTVLSLRRVNNYLS
ncbi:unnamed protein product [Lampetra fluviatilis]